MLHLQCIRNPDASLGTILDMELTECFITQKIEKDVTKVIKRTVKQKPNQLLT